MQFEKREINSLEKDGTYLDMRKNSIKDMIDGRWYLTNQSEVKAVHHLNGINDFYLLKGSDFVLFFDDLNSRDEAIKLFNDNFKPKGVFSEEIEKGIQSPQVIGPFEYNGKIGLWINATNLLNEIIDEEKGIYKGVIINPTKYFKSKSVIGDVKGQIEDIL